MDEIQRGMISQAREYGPTKTECVNRVFYVTASDGTTYHQAADDRAEGWYYGVGENESPIGSADLLDALNRIRDGFFYLEIA